MVLYIHVHVASGKPTCILNFEASTHQEIDKINIWESQPIVVTHMRNCRNCVHTCMYVCNVYVCVYVAICHPHACKLIAHVHNCSGENCQRWLLHKGCGNQFVCLSVAPNLLYTMSKQGVIGIFTAFNS